MIYRQLPKEEWARLDSIFRGELGECPPFSGTSCVVVAEEEGRIVGILTAQLILHTEPMWISPEYRRRYGVLVGLVSKLFDLLPDAMYSFVHVQNGSKFGKLLRRLGFIQQPWEIWRWTANEQSIRTNH